MRLTAALRRHTAPLGFTLIALLLLLAGVWLQPAPRGADTWGHLYRAEFLATQMHTAGVASWATAAWMPTWYLGDPFRTYYPPLTTLLLSPLHYVLGDTLLTYKVSATLIVAAFALLTYLALDSLFDKWPAALGTVVALWAPYQLRTLLFEGNYPRALALVALPGMLWLTERLLTGVRRPGTTVVLLGLIWAWMILAHTQQAYIFAIALGVFVISRLFLQPSIPASRAAWWLAGLVAGALLVFPWLLPAYSGAELADVPNLPAEKVKTFTATLAGLAPSLRMSDGRILIGLGAVLMAVLAAAARPRPLRTSLTLTGLACVWLSLGQAGVLFSLLPLHDQLLPERFLNVAAFALPAAASGLLPLRRARCLSQAFVIGGLVLIDALPGVDLLRPIPYPETPARLVSLGESGSAAGRMGLLLYPEPTAQEVYFAGQGAPLLQGWALENTPHHVALRRVLGAPEWGPEYLEARLSLWDVRKVIVAGDQEADASRTFLAGAGFEPIEAVGRYQVWQDTTVGGRVQAVASGQMLVLGDQLASFLGAFPFAEEVRTQHASEWIRPDLAQHPVLGLYRFETDPSSLANVEAWLVPYLEAGGRVIIDLSGMEDVIGRTVDFLGVEAVRLSVSGRVPLSWDADLAGMPLELRFEGLPEAGWSGAGYVGLDEVLGEMEWDGVRHALFGYRDVGRGRAWFIGMNLFYYAQLAGDGGLLETLREAVLDGAPVARSLRFEQVPVRDYQETAWGLSFRAQAAASGPAVISYTYSPRWEVRVDGQTVPFTSHEGLIRVDLPAGEHQVEVEYRPYGTIWPWLGLLLGGVGAAGVVVLLLLDRRLSPLPMPDADEPSAEILTYSPCANCGFHLAETRPPTSITYPFNAVACPICGLSMDDEGFRPGETLTEQARAAALDRWLSSHEYDPEVVHSRWGFSVADFFSSEAEGGPTISPEGPERLM